MLARRIEAYEGWGVAEHDGDDGPDGGSFSIYMLRTMQQHHVHLSAQADQKASMLMGATAVIMTLIFKDAGSRAVGLPLLCVAGASFGAAVLAILAVTPFTRPPPNENANLMFFGGFLGLKEEQFQQRMATIMASNGGVQRAMIRDVYQLGQVLGRRKYRLVTNAYRVFLLGLVAGFALFVAQLAGLIG